ncbi:hypothetical protein QR680_008208 [Steinernema hermaphroditum]|uniref:IF rod domain-containing protein n=1 Tax=Steinernema hermaphroditum TaxID=289476 RepID=A0AA39M6M6_9BILA|nr:hypothetical protein QR680_008208 [Steinernema hermaphroditum]
MDCEMGGQQSHLEDVTEALLTSKLETQQLQRGNGEPSRQLESLNWRIAKEGTQRALKSRDLETKLINMEVAMATMRAEFDARIAQNTREINDLYEIGFTHDDVEAGKLKKDLIDEKMDELRKTLDDVCTEKARLEIEHSKAVEGYDELKAKVSKLEKDLNASDRDRLNCQSLVQDLQARLNTAENRRKHAEDESTVLRGENNDLKRQRETLCRKIENEAALRTTLEDKLITLKEDLDFARKTHVSQMDEVKRKRQHEMTSVSNEMESRYQAQLQKQLQAMRADFDARIAQNRREIDELYKTKLSEANETASRDRSNAKEAREEAARARLRVHELETVLSSYNKQVDELNRKIADLESALRRTLSEYRYLMDLKVQLDVELQAYQKSCEGQESRRKHAEDEISVLRGENDDLKRQLETLRREIEDEAVLRTTLENKLTTLKKDLQGNIPKCPTNFARKTHLLHMDQVKRNHQLEMMSASNEMESRYQAQLQEQLETACTLRVYELKTAQASHKKQVDELNRKIADLESALQRSRDEMNINVSQRDEQIMDLEREIGRVAMDLLLKLSSQGPMSDEPLESEDSSFHTRDTSSHEVQEQFQAMCPDFDVQIAQNGREIDDLYESEFTDNDEDYDDRYRWEHYLDDEDNWEDYFERDQSYVEDVEECESDEEEEIDEEETWEEMWSEKMLRMMEVTKNMSRKKMWGNVEWKMEFPRRKTRKKNMSRNKTWVKNEWEEKMLRKKNRKKKTSRNSSDMGKQ